MDVEAKVKIVERGLHTLFTDKLLNRVEVTSEREPQIGGGAQSFKTMWKTASHTLSVERNGLVPATFWDYLKKYLPFMKPNLIHLEIHIIHQCPHRKVLEKDPHLNYLFGKAN